MADDRPLTRKYSRIERERRFLLFRLPEAVDPDYYQRLRDCYITGTHLRLRWVEAPDGALLVAKLGQKIVDSEAAADSRRRQMTTIYLPGHEAERLAGLEGVCSVKRRYKLREQSWTFCIDVYEEPAGAAGTILAEVECDTDAQLAAIVCPAWAEREVTDDDRWSGPNLASS